MRYSKFFLIIFLYIFTAAPLGAQTYPQDYFRNPLNIPISLAGNFGELRTNHFHTGIDIKTEGKEGLPVYAAADGYVSRIGISGGGYGNALYIDHPNGYTTVYGHLSAFNYAIGKYVKELQYTTESFEQNVLPGEDKFKVKKGDLIAYSGNTGGSAGPHLHFEIRDTKSEHPLNPLLFGFKVTDNTPPVIRGIKIYPLDSHSYVTVNYAATRRSAAHSLKAVYGKNIKLYVGQSAGKNFLKGVSSIEGAGRLGFAIDADDYIDGSYNKIGPYVIELCVNEKKVYSHRMEELDFSVSRFINVHTDYAERMKTGRWFEKSFINTVNDLPIYNNVKEDGCVILQPGNTTKITYYVRDVEDNMAVLVTYVKTPASPVDPAAEVVKDYDTLLPYNKPAVFRTQELVMKAPAMTFYDDLPLTYKQLPKVAKSYSDVHMLGSTGIPVNDYFDISIKADVPESLANKACIVANDWGYLGGTYANGWVSSKARVMGKFYVAVDDKAPTIGGINIADGRNLSKASGIYLRIRDDLAGIKSYRGTIDGKWVLFQYDAKSARIYYIFDEHCPGGKHTLEVEVTDEADNVGRRSFSFYR